MSASKSERLEEFFRRLRAAEAAATFEEARTLLERTLNAVEDEMTSIPYDPSAWMSDGRMYPPLDDLLRRLDGRPEVVRLRSRAHNTFIRTNGAIEIRTTGREGREGQVLLEKPGADGRHVWE